MNQVRHQETVVREHFRAASTGWGDRYRSRPRKMSDLDLLLRRESVHRLLHPLITAAERPLEVLDLGCGAGSVLDGLPRDSLRVLGADFVPAMVAEAARAHPGDRFIAADATRLPIRPASMDLVTCLGVLEYIPHPERAVAMMHTALRPGGRLVISFPNRVSLFRLLSGVEIRSEATLIRILKGQRGRHDEPSFDHRRWSFAEARRLLLAAGFELEAARFNTFGLWGRLGRLGVSLRLSALLSRRLGGSAGFSSRLACTMVMLARRPATDAESPHGSIGS